MPSRESEARSLHGRIHGVPFKLCLAPKAHGVKNFNASALIKTVLLSKKFIYHIQHHKKMGLSLIAAMAENRVIGYRNKLPWRLPADLKHFRQRTLNKPIIMGRKTFESIGKPLDKRTNIIVTQQKDYSVPNSCYVEHSLASALKLAQTKVHESEDILIIGGQSLYEQALPLANRMYLTLIAHPFKGDAFFPNWESKHWYITSRIEYLPDEHNPFPYCFITLERPKTQSSPLKR